MAVSDHSSRNEMAFLARLGLGQQNTNILTNLQNLIGVLFGFASVTMELPLRYEFGSRYLNLLRILAAWQLMRIYNFFLNLPEIVNLRLVYSAERTIHPWFMYSFLTLAAVHLLRIWIRERSGIVWHSRSNGISWLSALPISDDLLYRFVEPACVIAGGWLLRSLDGPTAGWLILAGIAMFVRNQITAGHQRDMVLDVVDAKIEARYINEAQSDKPKQATAGWQATPIPVGDFFTSDSLDIRQGVSETRSTDAQKG